jgi:hypothetical protein
MLRPLQLIVLEGGLHLNVIAICDFFPIPSFATIGNVRI